MVTHRRTVQPDPIHTVTPTSIRACYNQAWPAARSPSAVRELAKKAHAMGGVPVLTMIGTPGDNNRTTA